MQESFVSLPTPMHSEDLVFTVCATETAIELRPGYYESRFVRVICTCRSYEVALNFAQLAARINNLSIVDYVQIAERRGNSVEQGSELEGLKNIPTDEIESDNEKLDKLT